MNQLQTYRGQVLIYVGWMNGTIVHDNPLVSRRREGIMHMSVPLIHPT